jgi:serine/threonine protein phosphatase PrpC
MAKLPSLGGKPGVISAEPDIFTLNLGPEIDFILLCCDGVYDRLEVEDVTRIV